MTLIEYIKKSYLRPNRAVLKSLGASDELIEYLMESPWNMNENVVVSLLPTEESEEEGEKGRDWVILDDTITLTGNPETGIYSTLINTSFVYEDFNDVPDSIVVEIGGQSIELPHFPTNFGASYGEMEDDWGSFDTYPVWVWLEPDGSGEIASNVYGEEQKVVIKVPRDEGVIK